MTILRSYHFEFKKLISNVCNNNIGDDKKEYTGGTESRLGMLWLLLLVAGIIENQNSDFVKA